MKFFAATLLALTALSQTARADYVETTRAEAYRYEQQRKADQAQRSANAEAARERVYSSLANSFASAHGGFSGETKRYGYGQPLSQIGWTQARLIFSFSTRDGFDCGVLLTLDESKERWVNSAILDCVHPTSGKNSRKTVVMKSIPPTIL